MNLAGLIARFRTLSGDNGVPPLWSDETVTDWLNEAEREACLRAHLLEDDSTAEVVELAGDPDAYSYLLHPSIRDVIRLTAVYTTDPVQYRNIDRAEIEAIRCYRERSPTAAGRPCAFAVWGDGGEDAGRKLLLDRVPADEPFAFRLVVDRYPLAEMADQDRDSPEIAPEHHPHLVHWALHMAYQTRDMEGAALNRVDPHEQRFVKAFGERPDANVRRKRLRHQATVCRPIAF